MEMGSLTTVNNTLSNLMQMVTMMVMMEPRSVRARSQLVDSDGDGLQDGTEMGLTTGINDTDKCIHSNATAAPPQVLSTDSDDTASMTMPKTIKTERLTAKTDPNPDTDGDGLLDGTDGHQYRL